MIRRSGMLSRLERLFVYSSKGMGKLYWIPLTARLSGNRPNRRMPMKKRKMTIRRSPTPLSIPDSSFRRPAIRYTALPVISVPSPERPDLGHMTLTAATISR